MADIPPVLPSSVAQSGHQARELAAEKGARQAGEAHAAHRQTRAVDEAGSTVDTADADNRVFTDAEGGGSQGRFTEETPEEAESESQDPRSPQTGVTRDAQGQLHLDIQA
jgi:hypothetical protein